MTDVDYTCIGDFRDIETINAYSSAVANGKNAEEAFREAKRISRDNARSPMQWNAGENAGFSAAEPWIKVNSNHTEINVEAEEKDPDSVLNYYRALLSLRKENAALRRGDLKFIDFDSPDSFSYTRRLGDSEFAVISNFCAESRTFSFDFSSYSLLLSNYGRKEAKGSELLLRPYEAMVLKKTGKC